MEKYTVIVPTRDRAETLAATIRTCLRQNYQNFEIIVSDNCSNDNTREIIEQFHDQRIRYINPGRRLSMSGNFEFALGHVIDGFVMFIGSDDGIMPDAIDYVDSIVQKYQVDAVSCQQASYVWPNFPDKAIAGRLTFGGLGRNIEIRASKEWVAKALSFQTLYCYDLPNLYCGFVHKRIIDKAYKDGVYFRSVTPDAYSAFATAIFVDNYAFSFRPFSICGASAKSNGATAFYSNDNTEVNKFYSENNINFHEKFVNCLSLEIIGTETFAQLARAFPEHCAMYYIDYKTMLQEALRNINPKTEREVTDAVAIMAKNFSVDISDDSAVTSIENFNLARKLRSLGLMIHNYSEIIEIQKSYLVGIKDVDDAALAAHLFMQCKESSAFISRKVSMLRGLNRLLGSKLSKIK